MSSMLIYAISQYERKKNQNKCIYLSILEDFQNLKHDFWENIDIFYINYQNQILTTFKIFFWLFKFKYFCLIFIHTGIIIFLRSRYVLQWILTKLVNLEFFSVLFLNFSARFLLNQYLVFYSRKWFDSNYPKFKVCLKKNFFKKCSINIQGKLKLNMLPFEH